jgi:protein-L-isoaspartate O-methyltransferase
LITREEVELAYRLILGREPENDDVVENYMHTLNSLVELRHEFIKSPEFVEQISAALGAPKYVRQRHPFHFPRIPVEIDATKDELDRMFRRIGDTWERLGFTEPYWSVLTQPQYMVNNFSHNREQFYQSGGPLFRNFLASLKRNDLNPHKMNTCLEVGCGVGRMTAYLAETFNNVIATEISGQHLVMTRNYLESKGIKNVSLEHWKSLQDILKSSQVDVILSVITLQHNPPPIMAWILKQLLATLKTDGVAFIQMPTYRSGYIFEINRYLNSPNDGKIEMHYLPQNRIFELIDEANCRCLEVREDGMVGNEDKMLSNSFLIQKISN